MRWPLRFQIMVPMAAVMLVTVAGASGLNAVLAARGARLQSERQLRDVARTLSQATFPLTDAVLRQMRGLSGADFLLVDPDGSVRASSRQVGWLATERLPVTRPAEQWQALKLGRPVRLGAARYFHAVLSLPPRGSPARRRLLHVLYPEQNYRETWRAAVYPPLAVGAVSLLVVVAVAVAVGTRLSRPMTRLRNQVERIARGQFSPLPLPERNDEIRDLGNAVNRMAEMLAQYAEQLRRTERMRTLAQVGAGVAHQLRNSATGCRMALDLHGRECPVNGGSESLQVARRQLALMEKHIQRLLSLGRPQAGPLARVCLRHLIDQVLPLVRPAAEHAGARLHWTPPALPLYVHGDPAALEQLVVNLVLNAVEAVAGAGPDGPEKQVTLTAGPGEPGHILLSVEDNGPGPSGHLDGDLFEPFVTDKPSGVGLGLSVARQVAEQHGGRIRWERSGHTTRFLVQLPRAGMEPNRAKAIGG